MHKKIVLLSVLCFLLFSVSSLASNFYIGGGLNHNSASNLDSATGFQIFGGVQLPWEYDNFTTYVEAGYMNSGDFKFAGQNVGDASGLWVSALTKYQFSDELSGLVRLGYDFGDDDGLLFGFGGEYAFRSDMALRAEYVIRDNINSFQANYIYRF